MLQQLKIGDNIKAARKAAGLTQKQLAEASGVSVNAVWNYEKNERTPRLEALEQIAEVLGCPVQTLLTGEPHFNEIYPMRDYELIARFRNILFNIGVKGVDPTNPSDEELFLTVKDPAFKDFVIQLINESSRSLLDQMPEPEGDPREDFNDGYVEEDSDGGINHEEG